MSKRSQYKISQTKSGKFYVEGPYHQYGGYYKTRKGAERFFEKLMLQVGA